MNHNKKMNALISLTLLRRIQELIISLELKCVFRFHWCIRFYETFFEN